MSHKLFLEQGIWLSHGLQWAMKTDMETMKPDCFSDTFYSLFQVLENEDCFFLEIMLKIIWKKKFFLSFKTGLAASEVFRGVSGSRHWECLLDGIMNLSYSLTLSVFFFFFFSFSVCLHLGVSNWNNHSTVPLGSAAYWTTGESVCVCIKYKTEATLQLISL